VDIWNTDLGYLKWLFRISEKVNRPVRLPYLIAAIWLCTLLQEAWFCPAVFGLLALWIYTTTYHSIVQFVIKILCHAIADKHRQVYKQKFNGSHFIFIATINKLEQHCQWRQIQLRLQINSLIRIEWQQTQIRLYRFSVKYLFNSVTVCYIQIFVIFLSHRLTFAENSRRRKRRQIKTSESF